MKILTNEDGRVLSGASPSALQLLIPSYKGLRPKRIRRAINHPEVLSQRDVRFRESVVTKHMSVPVYVLQKASVFLGLKIHQLQA